MPETTEHVAEQFVHRIGAAGLPPTCRKAAMKIELATFPGAQGAMLAARLDSPSSGVLGD